MFSLMLAAFAMEGPSEGQPVADPALKFRGELAGRGEVVLKGALYPRFTLPRARVTGQIQGPMGASARVVTVIGPPGGPLAFNVQLAEARIDVPRTGLSIAAGQIDDLWSATHQPEWGLPEVAVVTSLSTGFMPRADLGAWMSWTAPEHRFSASVSGTRGFADDIHTDVSLLLTGRVIDTDGATVTLHAYGRLAKIGDVRNDRVGGTARLETGHIATSGSVLVGAATGQRQAPLMVTAHVRTSKKLPVVAWARGDVVWLSGTQASPNRQVLLGAGPKLPVRADGPVWLGLLYQGSDFASIGSPLLDPDISHSLGLQLSTDLKATVPL